MSDAIELVEEWEDMYSCGRDLDRKFVQVNSIHDIMIVVRVIHSTI